MGVLRGRRKECWCVQRLFKDAERAKGEVLPRKNRDRWRDSRRCARAAPTSRKHKEEIAESGTARKCWRAAALSPSRHTSTRMVSPNQLIFQEHCREVNYFIADLDEQISSLPTSTPQGPVGSGAHFNTLDSQPGNLSWTQLHGALQVTWPTGRISPADINAGPQGVSVVARLFERVGAAEVVELGCEGKNEVIGWLRELRKQVGERANEERRCVSDWDGEGRWC